MLDNRRKEIFVKRRKQLQIYIRSPEQLWPVEIASLREKQTILSRGMNAQLCIPDAETDGNKKKTGRKQRASLPRQDRKNCFN